MKKAITIWLLFAVIFAVIAYPAVLLSDDKVTLPLAVPFSSACFCLLCIFGALGTWAKGEEYDAE